MYFIVTKSHLTFSKIFKHWQGKSWVTSTSCFSSTGEARSLKKKDISIKTLSSKYDFKEVQSIWYDWWESQNYFKPTKSKVEPFVILLPPPNITGTLHLGHVLTATIQDVILRWRRMKGETVVWIPGIDHAGIATQVAVEKQLKHTLKMSRHDMGKEQFLNLLWDWKHDKETKIYEQLRSVGASLDWSRVKFTMSPEHSNLVAKSFITLYNKGLIYRNTCLVNWSCALKSSISDIEVEWEKITKATQFNVPGYEKPIEFGKMYQIAYKVCDEDDEIIVHTTRPETILGDVAVAVNTNDQRYTKYIKKMVWNPFRCEKIPVIADDFVDPNLGSGAVKITPSHSPEDFEVGQRHNLKGVDVINEDGVLNNIGHNNKLFGLKRYEAREVILDELSKLNLFRGAYEHPMTIPYCSRSGDVIEHILKSQWFLNCQTLAADAIDLVKKGHLKLVPDNHENVWYTWLNNLKDWNLSRQIWWGHQIPMFNCSSNGKEIWLPALSLKEAELKASEMLSTNAENIQITQDPDVLDTWFSSALLPLSTLSDYTSSDKPPISLMVTGHDILFFWVARMVFLSRSLTGKLPFNEVLLHGLICDSRGRKMSKSLGNVIRPEDVENGRSLKDMKEDIRKILKEGMINHTEFQIAMDAQKKMFPEGIPPCGMDALRFSLCNYNFHSGFINFDIKICHASRDFCNKMWQAARYVIKIMTDCEIAGQSLSEFKYDKLDRKKLNVLDRWILSRMASLVNTVDKNISSYNFSIATTCSKIFVTEEFCGVYLECSKSFVRNDPTQYKKVILILMKCMETYLKLLSPFMPFVTEHLYQALPQLKGFNKSKSIMTAAFPIWEDWKTYRDEELEQRISSILRILSSTREVLSSYNMIGTKPIVYLKCPKTLEDIIFGETALALATLGRVDRFLPEDNHNGVNAIERVINDDTIAYIKHKFDKKTLVNMFSKTIKKEKSTRDAIKALNAKMENEKPTQSQSFKYRKQMNTLEETISKIEEFKKVIENCTR